MAQRDCLQRISLKSAVLLGQCKYSFKGKDKYVKAPDWSIVYYYTEFLHVKQVRRCDWLSVPLMSFTELRCARHNTSSDWSHQATSGCRCVFSSLQTAAISVSVSVVLCITGNCERVRVITFYENHAFNPDKREKIGFLQ